MSNAIAQTILAQLGGNRFTAMTGARALLDLGDGLQFDLPRGARNCANKVSVRLTPADLYDVRFMRFNRRTLDVETISQIEGVDAESLRRVFTSATGLETSL